MPNLAIQAVSSWPSMSAHRFPKQICLLSHVSPVGLFGVLSHGRTRACDTEYMKYWGHWAKVSHLLWTQHSFHLLVNDRFSLKTWTVRREITVLRKIVLPHWLYYQRSRFRTINHAQTAVMVCPDSALLPASRKWCLIGGFSPQSRLPVNAPIRCFCL